MMKTFRGLMADGSIEKVNLGTINGRTGYRIHKLEMIPEKPGQTDHRFVIQIFKTEQTVASATVNFSDNTLLAAGEIEDNAASHYPNSSAGIVFEQEIFNQDIYITMKDASTGESCNYYLELQQIKLDGNETAVATLKNIKNRG
jgi:hypothetical protein